MGLLYLLPALLKLLEILIVLRVLISWVPPWANTPFGQTIIGLTEPMLQPLRRAMGVQVSGLGLDFSPMVAIVIIQLVRMVL